MRSAKTLLLVFLITSFLISRTTWALDPVAPTIISPTSGGHYIDEIPISYIISNLNIVSGSVEIVFTEDEGGEVTLTMSDSTSVDCTLDLANPLTSCADVMASSAGSIPNGHYTIELSYYENGNPSPGRLAVNSIAIGEEEVVGEEEGGGEPPTFFDVYAPEPDSTISNVEPVTVSYLIPADSNCSSVVFILGDGVDYYFFPVETIEGELVETTIDLAEQDVPVGSDYMAIIQCRDEVGETLSSSTEITNLTVSDEVEEESGIDGGDDSEEEEEESGGSGGGGNDDTEDDSGGGTTIDTGALNLNAACQLNRTANTNTSTAFAYFFMLLALPRIIHAGSSLKKTS